LKDVAESDDFVEKILTYSENLINMSEEFLCMRKLFATVIALTEGKVSIESVGKSAVLKTPGDVTVGGHQ
jgi:hypothetical protein